MKKLLILLGITISIAACNSDTKSSGGLADDTTEVGENSSAAAQQSSVDTNVNKIGTDPANPQSAKGEQLISGSDCLSCHQTNEKLIGPSYVEVANKYENNEKNREYLAGKIISGGSGVWGEIPMTPHPALSEGDAQEMAAYIMSLKTN